MTVTDFILLLLSMFLCTYPPTKMNAHNDTSYEEGYKADFFLVLA